ncbi:MAG: glutamate--tRNA ligase [Candidatus Sumerlaeia bacterium]|nr:glutamate--tRNA ligase [Candidatus Sumerlaeia bacterium]
MTVRVRFAPSPTGYLHVGGARTALFNWLWARHNGGTFILRIEDTDLERSTDASTDQILDSLKWLGLDWDEGPFFQSKRGDVYRAHLQKLADEGKIYRAFETHEELEAAREKAQAEGRDWVYNRASLRLTPEEVQEKIRAGVPFVWRLKVPDGQTRILETLMTGPANNVFENSTLGDFALTRAGTEDNWGDALFNFCCAVDDAVMGITNVIRGSDHITNTARQTLILNALGYPSPTYTHLPLITKEGKKMSKRDGDADPRFPVSVSARRDRGYLKETVINFLALLGWSWDGQQEIFTVEELVKKFSVNALSKSNANFDEQKFLHMNSLYLKQLGPEVIAERVLPFLEQAGLRLGGSKDQAWLARAVAPELERCKLLTDFPEALRYYFEAPTTYEPKAVEKACSAPETGDILREVAEALKGVGTITQESFEATINSVATPRGLGFGKVAQPVRIALTGRGASPGLTEVIENLGVEESVSRILACADWLVIHR